MSKLTQPTTNRRRRSPSDLREEILEAARTVYSSNGYAGSTLADIARRARTTETQIFRYFDSKAELFSEAMLHPLEGHLKSFMRDGQDFEDASTLGQQASRYISELQSFIRENKRLLISLVNAQESGSKEVPGIGRLSALRDYFQQGAKIMEERTGGDSKIPPELMVRISFAAVLASTLFEDWLYPDSLVDPRTIQDSVARFVIDGLYADPVTP